jgi:aspartyl/glutamyl-tRNA(Asn/Gln) amidotransferase, B subunit
MAKQYETVIGLEVHVELSTQTKIFCGCSSEFGGVPNAHTCPTCTGMPGSLPVLNKQVVEYAVALGKAMNCEINQYCRFDRKNYFYPDNPQNYQISQLYLPICGEGWLEVSTDAGMKRIRIHEIHMEEDAGKLTHDEWEDCSLVDYNRSGVPLLEVVSEPDMRTAEEVIAYLEKLRMLCQYLEISDCKLQEGSMRADVNLSIREVGSTELGTRTEMKNLNSFKAIVRAINGERERQIELLAEGKEIIQETRRWDDNKEASYAMRSKEDAKDYRYFPDPDLQPIVISDEWIEQIQKKRPEFQEEKAIRYQREYNLSNYDALVLTQSKHLAEMFEKTAKACNNPKKAANWFMGEVFRQVKEKSLMPKDVSFTPQHLADLILALERKEISQQSAREIFIQIIEQDVEPLSYIKEYGLLMVQDNEAVEKVVDEVLQANPKVVEEFQEGKEKVIGFLVGQVMKQMKGKADATEINQMILRKIK